jgi:putative membrane protein
MVKVLKIDLKRIELAISQAEQNTAGEIVIWISEKSFSVATIRWALTCFFAIAGYLFLELSGLFPSVTETFATSGIEQVKQTFFKLSFGAFFGFALSSINPLTRWISGLVFRSKIDQEIENRAFATFLKAGLTNTKDRTGVLVFVSLFEHKVIILADQGINSKVEPGLWKKHSEQIAQGFRSNDPTASLEKSVQDIGQVLALHFPPVAHNPNEISNRIRIGTD